MMRSGTARQARRCWLLGLWIAAFACGEDATPGGGGLVVVLDTDLAVPKDIDRVRLEFTQAGTVLRVEEHAIGENQVLIPARFRMRSVGNDDPVRVQATAYRADRARIERHAVTPIPMRYTAALRLPLNYLCDGYVGADQDSSCPDGMTCNQGTCISDAVDSAKLPVIELSAAETAMSGVLASSDGSDGSGRGIATREEECFDVLSCFGSFVIAEPNEGCSITLEPDVDVDRVNVALALPATAPGICDREGCWVPLDRGADGWMLDGSELRLPASVCRERPDGLPYAVAVSTACAAKTSATPPCGSWSSATVPIRAEQATTLPRPAIGQACAGRPSESCGQCGSRSRTCRDGAWSDWSACTGEGVCAAGEIRACGQEGTQTCDASCEWGACGGQSCGDEPVTQACGRCGTQARTCDNGTWSAWEDCTGEGACAPGEQRSCDNEGSQTCRGDCGWGGCNDQRCEGPDSEPCERCGTRTRSCDPASGRWSEWSACEGARDCEPDERRSCGNGGTQVCGGDCRWDQGCSGQECGVPLRESCGHCGTHTRSCDPDTGAAGEWSACMNEGCEPGDTRECGSNALRFCGDDCRWGADCVVVCEGPFTETCDGCGVRTRGCDLERRMETPWSECQQRGECRPGQRQTCEFGGTQICSDACLWSECPNCPPNEPLERLCGNCSLGRQTRTCTASGLSDWSECVGGGECDPNAGPQRCLVNGSEPGPGETAGEQSCTDNCSWNDCVCPAGTQRTDTGCRRIERLCRRGQILCPLEPGAAPSCVDANTDAHCGGCDPCRRGLSCIEGVCCIPGQPCTR